MSKRSDPNASSGLRKKRRVDPRVPIFDEKTGERVDGVRKTRTGERYECKIYHPVSYRDIWVGTFDTVLEASEAYQARKKQLDESAREGKICGEFDFKSRVFDEKTGKRIAGVWRTRAGDRYDTKIHDPITRKDIWIGTFDTIKQASEAYNAKKREFDQLSVKGGRRRGRTTDNMKPVSDKKSGEGITKKYVTQTTSESSSEATDEQHLKMAPDKSSKEINVSNFEDLQVKGVRVTSDEYRGGGAKGFLIPTEGGGESFMPFMDNHGFLLGEFSKVDDFLDLTLRLGTGNNSLS